MGLSNEERQEQITVRADEIFYLACEIQEKIDEDKRGYYNKDIVRKLCQEAKTIWHALLRSSSNGMFWLLGGAVGAEVKSNDRNPLSFAIQHFLESEKPKSQPEQMLKEWDCENIHKNHLTHLSVTENASPVFGKLLRLYANLEGIIYALRRYDDDFRRSYVELDQLVSSLFGQCYHIFKTSDVVVHCYLISDIAELLLHNETFDEICKKMNLQHHMRYLNERDVNELVTLHQEVHESLIANSTGLKRPPLDVCIKVFLKLANRRFHYDHEFNQLKKELQNINEKVDWSIAEELFKTCKKAHEEDNKTNSERYQQNSDLDHMTAIHGFDYVCCKSEPS